MAKLQVAGPTKKMNVFWKVNYCGLILLAIKLFDKDWKKVTSYVGTRISAQVRSHAQKVLSDYSNSNRKDQRNESSEESGPTQVVS